MPSSSPAGGTMEMFSPQNWQDIKNPGENTDLPWRWDFLPWDLDIFRWSLYVLNILIGDFNHPKQSYHFIGISISAMEVKTIEIHQRLPTICHGYIYICKCGICLAKYRYVTKTQTTNKLILVAILIWVGLDDPTGSWDWWIRHDKKLSFELPLNIPIFHKNRKAQEAIWGLLPNGRTCLEYQLSYLVYLFSWEKKT